MCCVRPGPMPEYGDWLEPFSGSAPPMASPRRSFPANGLVSVVRRFMESASAGGIVLMIAAALAMLIANRSEEHTSELQSLMRISYADFCLKKTRKYTQH